MACSVTASQPWPWWELGRPGPTVRARLSSRTPRSAQGERSPVAGGGWPRSVAYSAKMLRRLAGSGPDVGGDGEAQADGVAGRRVRVLADDEDADVVERVLEGAQDVLARREVAAARGGLGAQEAAELGELGLDGREGLRPAGVDRLDERAGGHVRRGRSPGAPSGTRRISLRRADSGARMHPSDTACPIDSTAGVPWIASRSPPGQPGSSCVWCPVSASAQQP